jgi:hypothetical protein
MFKTFRISGLRAPWPRQVTLHRAELAHANDNLRLPARPLQCPPKLACRWVVNDGGRPECHWKFESDGSTSTDAPQSRSGRVGNSATALARTTRLQL